MAVQNKGLLVVSFGTSYAETAEKTIGAIEADLREAYPERVFHRAWTSRFIRARVEREQGIHTPSVEEALSHMREAGITDVLLQPTHMLAGKEYRAMVEAIEPFRTVFSRIAVGAPLLEEEADRLRIAEAVPHMLPMLGERDVLVFMGHGVPEGDNTPYLEMENAFRKKGLSRVAMALVEAEPYLKDRLDWIRGKNPETVYLAPFLVVAGDHATKDMAGDEADSWKEVLRMQGFTVSCIVKGMGEYREVRELYVEHAAKALRAETE